MATLLYYIRIKVKHFFIMRDDDKMETIARIHREIEDLERELKKDDDNGYLLRPYVRSRFQDRVETLRQEEREILNNLCTEN